MKEGRRLGQTDKPNLFANTDKLREEKEMLTTHSSGNQPKLASAPDKHRPSLEYWIAIQSGVSGLITSFRLFAMVWLFITAIQDLASTCPWR
jgi:hypothetical protein